MRGYATVFLHANRRKRLDRPYPKARKAYDRGQVLHRHGHDPASEKAQPTGPGGAIFAAAMKH